MSHWDWTPPPKGQGGGSRGGGKRRKGTRRTRGGKTVMSTANSWHRAMQGSKGVKTYTPYRMVKDLIKTRMKEHRLTERDAIRAVADTFGVKQRTVKSWIHPVRTARRLPRAKTVTRIRVQHESPEVRRSTMTSQRVAKMSREGMRVKLSGNVGPKIGGKSYQRFRTITNLYLPPEAAEHVMDTYAESGPEAANEALREAMEDHYDRADPKEWEFDEVTELGFFNVSPDETPEWFGEE